MVEPEKSMVSNTGSDFKPIPEGMYSVQVTDVILKENQEGYQGKIVDKLWFKIGILNEEFRGDSLTHFVSTTFTAGYKGGKSSKLYDFACAITGETLEDTNPLDVNSLVGGRLRIVVKQRTSANGKVYSNISDVMKEDSASKKLEGFTEEELLDLVFKSKTEEETVPEMDVTDIDLDSLEI